MVQKMPITSSIPVFQGLSIVIQPTPDILGIIGVMRYSDCVTVLSKYFFDI